VATLPLVIETPCGPKTIKVPLPDLVPIPDISLLLNFVFPPPFPFPMPDCSVLDHTGSAPEPPEDSEP
jgi:hypothetical protein